MRAKVAAFVFDRAGLGLDESVEHAERRRLARAVRAEQSEHRTRAAFERERIDDTAAVVALHEPVRAQEGGAHRRAVYSASARCKRRRADAIAADRRRLLSARSVVGQAHL